MTKRGFTLALSAGILLALLSSWIESRSRATYMDIDGCVVACDVAAAGWPFAYALDYPGLSVAGSAGIVGILLGEDRLDWLKFGLTTLFWVLLAAVGLLTARRLRRFIRRGPAA